MTTRPAVPGDDPLPADPSFDGGSMPESLAGYVRADDARKLLGLSVRTYDRRLSELPVVRDPRDRRYRLIRRDDLARLGEPVPLADPAPPHVDGELGILSRAVRLLLRQAREQDEQLFLEFGVVGNPRARARLAAIDAMLAEIGGARRPAPRAGDVVTPSQTRPGRPEGAPPGDAA